MAPEFVGRGKGRVVPELELVSDDEKPVGLRVVLGGLDWWLVMCCGGCAVCVVMVGLFHGG